MLKIRRPLGRLIFNMGIAIPGKTVFLIETAPCSRSAVVQWVDDSCVDRLTNWLWWAIRKVFQPPSQQYAHHISTHTLTPLAMSSFTRRSEIHNRCRGSVGIGYGRSWSSLHFPATSLHVAMFTSVGLLPVNSRDCFTAVGEEPFGMWNRLCTLWSENRNYPKLSIWRDREFVLSENSRNMLPW